jgi:hypothetical protein
LALGNSTSPRPRCGSRSQAFTTASVDLAIGVPSTETRREQHPPVP